MSDKTKRVSYELERGEKNEFTTKRTAQSGHSGVFARRFRRLGSYSLGLLTHSIDAKECAKRVKTCDEFSAEGGREAKNFRCFVREKDSM